MQELHEFARTGTKARKPLKRSWMKAGSKPMKRTPMKRRIKSSVIPYGTNSVSKKKATLRQKVNPELVAWGKAVKERDGNKCQWKAFGPCATGDTRIDPHHIAPRGRRPDLRYVVANGIALCRTHHDWVGDHPIEAEAMGLISSETYEKARRQI